MTVPRTGDPKARRAILGLWLGAALLSAAMVIACGRKGPPVAPRQIPPPAVADLAGHLQEDHLVLTWSLAADAAQRDPEPAGFNLYRARRALSEAACDNCPKIFEASARIAFAPADTSVAGKLHWRYEVPLEKGFHYIFKLRTVLADGQEGPDSNLVELDH
jgi:hypothetical protein